MKLFLLVISSLIIASIVTIATVETEQGAEESAHKSFWDTSEVRVVTVKGHEYIIVNGSNRGGIVHSESCPCKNGGAR